MRFHFLIELPRAELSKRNGPSVMSTVMYKKLGVMKKGHKSVKASGQVVPLVTITWNVGSVVSVPAVHTTGKPNASTNEPSTQQYATRPRG